MPGEGLSVALRDRLDRNRDVQVAILKRDYIEVAPAESTKWRHSYLVAVADRGYLRSRAVTQHDGQSHNERERKELFHFEFFNRDAEAIAAEPFHASIFCVASLHPLAQKGSTYNRREESSTSALSRQQEIALLTQR